MTAIKWLRRRGECVWEQSTLDDIIQHYRRIETVTPIADAMAEFSSRVELERFRDRLSDRIANDPSISLEQPAPGPA